MGLDIYAGTLTRYYSHNWKTVVQQWAEENGYSFNRITPDGEPADDEELSPTDVQAAVENWRDQILAAISQPDQPPYAPWPENNEKPYYGEAVPTRTYDEEHFTANIEVDPSGTFYGWVFKFMGGIQIIAPHECVEEMKRIAHRFL